MGRRAFVLALALPLILAGAALLGGCGARRRQVFAYPLPNFPLRTARAGADPPPPVLPARLADAAPRRHRRRHAGRRRESSARLDLNRAPLARLEHVPGLTPALAARIIAARPFRAKRALLRRGLLSPAAYARAKRYLVVHRPRRSRTAGG